MKTNNSLSSRMAAKRDIHSDLPENEPIRHPSRRRQRVSQKEKKENNKLVRKKKKEAEKNFDAGWRNKDEKRARNRLKDSVLDFENVEITDPELDLSKEEQVEEMKNIRLQKKRDFLQKASSVLAILACVYIIFLIYGCLSTNYAYNQNGELKPEKMSVKEIKEYKAFNKVYSKYLTLMVYYKKVLVLDYRYAKEGAVIGTEYSALTKDLNDLGNSINGMTVDESYVGYKETLITTAASMMQYCELMSSAIANNNQEEYANAMTESAALYEYFTAISVNMVTTGQNIKGIDLSPVIEFNPDTYAEQRANGEVK